MPNLQTFERTEYQQVKADLHRKILDRLDLEKLGRTPSDHARDEVLLLIRNTVNSEAVPLSFAERERLSREILDEIFGLGPLEPLLKDPTVSDILVNNRNVVYVERRGILERTSATFRRGYANRGGTRKRHSGAFTGRMRIHRCRRVQWDCQV